VDAGRHQNISGEREFKMLYVFAQKVKRDGNPQALGKWFVLDFPE
jgi:hypothetical protein